MAAFLERTVAGNDSTPPPVFGYGLACFTLKHKNADFSFLLLAQTFFVAICLNSII